MKRRMPLAHSIRRASWESVDHPEPQRGTIRTSFIAKAHFLQRLRH